MIKQITQPKDTNYLKWNRDFKRVRMETFERAQKYVDSEVIRRTEPFVPLRDGYLRRSAILHTRIGSGEVNYVMPYARRLYYSHGYKFNRALAPQATDRWFEHMKISNRENILNGAARILRG